MLQSRSLRRAKSDDRDAGGLPSGKRAGAYRVEHLLGAGFQGAVYLAVAPDGQRVALKGTDRQADWQVEAELLSQLWHSGVPTYHGAFQEGAFYWMVMEYVPGVEPHKHLPYRTVLVLGARLAGTLAYLHGQGIIHRDIKPENTLITHDPAGRVVLTDFGIAIQRCRRVGFERAYGTLGYAAPEQYRKQSCFGSDIYALGIMLYELLARRRPDPLVCAFPPLPRECSQAVARLLLTMLSLTPGERPSAAEVEQQLSHLASATAMVSLT